MSRKAVVVFSGGLDSSTALAWAAKNCERVKAITFWYGSKHNEVENEYSRRLCESMGIEREFVKLPFVATSFRSALLQTGGSIPEQAYDSVNMKDTVVPFRNGIMLAIAAGYAESIGFDSVVLGNHSGDHAIYPDCRAEFISKIGDAIKVGTDAKIDVLSPFCHMTKSQIVTIGARLNVDFSKTYSCYNGRVKHCGKCATCLERKDAFKEAGINDPTEYEV